MPILQPIIDLVELCAIHGIENAILCPGSRSAAITMAFVRNPKIKCHSISDERSAGFIAIGMALKTKKPIVIVCTSGSAVYNFAPAVVEAYFQQIPILVITADRPAEWIHQNDGQTIYQPDIYGKNIKKSYNLLADFAHSDTSWFYQRTVNEAINYCKSEPKGPVHINIPIREPFYPKSDEIFEPSQNPNFIKFIETEKKVTNNEIYDLLAEIRQYDKILIAVGQTEYDSELNTVLEKIQKELHFPVLADVISNIRIEHISNQDNFFSSDNEAFKPDLLITLGKSFISKSFKKYFQNHKVQSHWHLTNDDKIIDPTQSITKIININPTIFLNNLFQDIDYQLFKEGDDEFSGKYLETLKTANQQAEKLKYDFIKEQTAFSEIVAYFNCIQSLPSDCDIHLANSMAVRYANLLSFDFNKNIEVFANRGTSGIDGCLSTAVGAAMQTDKLVYLFIGDVAFFYDRNALWNNYLPKNLRVIVFNNAGGGIFRLIDGPSQQPELEDFFETKQNLSAKSTILEAGFDYFSVKNLNELSIILENFSENKGQSKCLEIFTNGKTNQKVFKEFKAFVKV